MAFSDPIDELIQLCQTLDIPSPLTQEEGEKQLQDAAWKKDWDPMLQLFDRIPGPVSRETAIICLSQSIHGAPFPVFRALLDHLPGKEYAYVEEYKLNWSPTGEKPPHSHWEVTVHGTLVMHAVAENRPDVLLELLERGCDANSASPAAAAGLLNDCGEHVITYGREFVPFYPYTARPESSFSLHPWDNTPNDVPPLDWVGATPLALALLMGHAECARILTSHGAWLEKAPGVSQAMYLFWAGENGDYQQTRAIVLAQGGSDDHRPHLWAVAHACSSDQLRLVLNTYAYASEELICAAQHMLHAYSRQAQLWLDPKRRWQQLCQRLLLLGQACPDVLLDPEVVGALLNLYSKRMNRTLDPFMPFFQGQTLDISLVGAFLYRLTQPDDKRLLETLAEHCTLVLDRDAVSPGIDAKTIRLLLKHTTLLPPSADRGISGLTLAILRCGDLRLLRRAIQEGIIPPEESTQELLRCQQESMSTPEFRLVLLTTPRPAAARPLRHTTLPSDLRSRWFADPAPDGTMPPLTQLDRNSWFHAALRCPGGTWKEKILGNEWKLHAFFFAACAQGREDIVARWLEHTPWQNLQNTNSLYCEQQGILMVTTPLCLAAFAGQTGVVRLLLEHGAPADEHLWGNPSVWYTSWAGKDTQTAVPIDPLLAAFVGKHWETAQLLLEHGAVYDRNDQRAQELWRCFHTEDFTTALQQHLPIAYEHFNLGGPI